mgnify:CR=1 FL=1
MRHDSGITPADRYQLANAVYDAYVGLHTRETFEDWDATTAEGGTDLTPLYDAWVDAGERLEPRLSGLAREVATGETSFPAAAGLACSAVKHGIDPPTPFGALDTDAFREYGADYAIKWADKTMSTLAE